MKKLIVLVLVLVFVLGLLGCSKTDLIPMVMVDGELYLDTGKNNGELLTSDVIDGEITSEVNSNKFPTRNEQSNFGTGYSYRYGKTEGTIEICLNNKWRIFATEEVRQQIQFPNMES